MSASNPYTEVFDLDAGCTQLVVPQRHNRLWSHRHADINDSLALARLIRSSNNDGLSSVSELLPAIAVAGFIAQRTKRAKYGSFAAFRAGALERNP